MLEIRALELLTAFLLAKLIDLFIDVCWRAPLSYYYTCMVATPPTHTKNISPLHFQSQLMRVQLKYPLPLSIYHKRIKTPLRIINISLVFFYLLAEMHVKNIAIDRRK